MDEQVGATTEVWRNRIVRYGEADVDQVLANENNWRIHPRPQANSFISLAKSVGIVQNIIINLRTSELWPGGDRKVETLVDGHMRVGEAIACGQKKLPATYVDLTPDEEATILASFDSLAVLAKPDKQQLDDIINSIRERSLQQSASDITGIIPTAQTPAAGVPKNPVPNMELRPFEHYDYIMFVFTDSRDFLAAATMFDLKPVNCGVQSHPKIGIGRVINGQRLLQLTPCRKKAPANPPGTTN